MPLLDKYPAPLTAKAAEHLLRRTMFGASRADIATLTGKTVDQALNILLADQAAPAAPVDPTTGQTWVNDTMRSQNDGVYNNYMKAWWVGLMASQPLSITEKMTLFWHNHFASSWSVVNDSRYMYVQHQTLRKNALGNVKNFVRDITSDPAMLRYLNGNRNVVGSPQENYGRELQELFTIGKGAEIAPGNYTTYTEDDVKAAAKVLTGWNDNQTNITSSFVANRHDTTDKQFSSAYQNTVIKGRTGANAGLDELNDLLTMIFKQTATSEYLVTKLYRFFVNFQITDAVKKEVITPLAKIFRDNNFEVKPVLRALLSSVHFFDNNVIGCMIKAPLDLLVGTLRQLQIKTPNPSQVVFYYGFYAQIQNLSAALQQNLFELPNVAGWSPYYQEPLFYQIWVNTATMPSRANYSNTVTNGWSVNDAASNSTQRVLFDSVVFLQQFPNPEDPIKVIDNLTQNFFAIDLSDVQKEQLLSTVLLPGLPEYEWTKEWNDFMQTPNDAQKKAQIKSKLDNLVRYMMRLAEYQIT
jgi:uncharacterized protein (DUF1800 family)